MKIASSCAYECCRAWHIEAPTINSGGFKQESTNSPNRRQTADVRIFIMEDKAQWSYFSKNYRRAVRCIKCSTMHDRVQLVHKISRKSGAGGAADQSTRE